MSLSNTESTPSPYTPLFTPDECKEKGVLVLIRQALNLTNIIYARLIGHKIYARLIGHKIWDWLV